MLTGALYRISIAEIGVIQMPMPILNYDIVGDELTITWINDTRHPTPKSS
jgi:hypothetical protein